MWRNSGYVSNAPDIFVSFGTPIEFVLDSSNEASGSEVQYDVGDWVVVQYDGEEYPGEVTAVSTEDVTVSVLHRSGGYFK